MTDLTWLFDIIYSALFVALVVAAVVLDVWKLRIPNTIPVALVALFVAAGLRHPTQVSWFGHLWTAGAVFAVGAVAFRFRVLAGGDVKLLAALSLWPGPALLPFYLAAVGLIGGVLGLFLLAARRFLGVYINALCQRLERPVPPALLPDGPVPYGVAIGTATFVMASRLPVLSN